MKCNRCARDIPDDAAICCYCGRQIVRKPPSRVHQRPNGTGTAYRRGSVWQASVTVGWVMDENGKARQKRVCKSGFKTKTEALAYCAALMDQTQKKAAPTLADYWTSYRGNELPHLSDSKQTAYEIAWSKLKSVSHRRIDSLSVTDLRKVVSDQTQTYYPARDMKVVLSHLFQLGAADGWCSKDLPSFIILPDKNEKERQPFTTDEQAALWTAYESGCADAAMPLIMIYTGMMTGEMRQLETSMIDFEHRQVIGVGLKTAIRKASPVYLPDDIVPVLQEVISGRDGLLYPCSEDIFYSRYYAALEAAGVRKLTPYSCRHTTATALAINENVAPETVRKIMRWSSTAMLSRYAHPDDDAARNAANTMKRCKL